MFRTMSVALALSLCMIGLTTGTADAQTDKPNILVSWGDDIGIFNISAYSHGMMGYQTPNIDRVAKEGAIFTDFYAEQSCTAGRSSFITGQIPFRNQVRLVQHCLVAAVHSIIRSIEFAVGT